ncbi:MAG: site-2 protease family protein [candidate division Zixibacteria bacterium]|nr:site-2 protease family protein [candidate division Zixibacteria bacterium]
MLLRDPAFLILYLPVLLFALTFHEAAHAWMAYRLGDPTARLLGRLTLNPLPHIDIWGALMLVISGVFGWAKPVPVDPRRFANPKQGIFLTAAAGPASNVLLAIGCGILIRLMVARGWGSSIPEGFSGTVGRIFAMGLVMNLSLAFFNLIPLPPLDGSKILYGLAPAHWEAAILQMERVGPLFLMLLIMVGFVTGFSPIWFLIGPIISVLTYILSGVPFGVLQGLIHL